MKGSSNSIVHFYPEDFLFGQKIPIHQCCKLQTKQCDSYKKIIFFQNKTFLQQQQSVSWCVYIFYPGMSTLFNLSACVHWVFSATNGNSLTQQFRLFLTDSPASLNGNLSGKGEIGLCKLFWYLCCICICV